MTVLLVALWLLIGINGFVFWWTREHDLTVVDCFFALVSGGILGPISWLVGWTLHGEHGPPKIVMRRRS